MSTTALLHLADREEEEAQQLQDIARSRRSRRPARSLAPDPAGPQDPHLISRMS